MVLLLLTPLLIVTLVFSVELLAGLARLLQREFPGENFRKAVIIPAHNEQVGIGATIEALRAALGSLRDVLVVADNCTDDTVGVCQRAGAAVIERKDTSQRGKGYALDFARSHLRESPPDVVIVLDADCRSDRRSLEDLAEAAVVLRRPCQAVNLLTLPDNAGSLVRISTFAFLVKNLIRQRGLQRLAKAVHLTGTGMALPWAIFDQSQLATADIVEDLSLGLDLQQKGYSPQLVGSAIVTSPASSTEGTLAQRSRWEGGYLQVSTTMAPRLLSRAIARRDLRGIFWALDLFVPPIALLAAVDAIAFGGLLIATATGMAWSGLALAVAVLLLGFTTGALAAVWWREGQTILRLTDIVGVPLYVLRKFPFYLKLVLVGAPRDWIRGERRSP